LIRRRPGQKDLGVSHTGLTSRDNRHRKPGVGQIGVECQRRTELQTTTVYSHIGYIVVIQAHGIFIYRTVGSLFSQTGQNSQVCKPSV
jgi:hypothetical protein